MRDSQANIFDAIDKSLSEYSSNKENGLFMAGIGSMVFGGVVGAFFPAYPIAQYGSYAIGALSIILHFLENWDTKWDKIFKSLNLYMEKRNGELILPKVVKRREIEDGEELMITLPLGLTSKDFEEQQLAIEEHLNAKIEIEYKNKHIFLTIKNKKQNHLYPYQFVKTSHPLEILLGIDEKTKKTITFKLDSARPHICIGGETGGGKTVWIITMLVNIIKNIINNHKFNCVDIDIVDFKRVDYTEFYDCKYIKHFIRDIYAADRYFYGLVKEMNRRINLLEKTKSRNIDAYNLKSENKLKYKLVIIDEFADISKFPDKEIQKRMINNLDELMRKARAVGIHFIGATQKASADSIPTSIRGNMPVKIAFRSEDGKMSEVILGNGDAKKLRGMGHGIYKHTEQIEFQGMFINDRKEGEVYKLIKESCVTDNKNNDNSVKPIKITNEKIELENVKTTTIKSNNKKTNKKNPTNNKRKTVNNSKTSGVFKL